MERVTPDPIEIGAHIDPEGHSLYRIPEDGVQYSIAPHDFNTSLERAAFDQKLYTVKQLEHARLLLVAYLAGKQGGKVLTLSSLNQPLEVVVYKLISFRKPIIVLSKFLILKKLPIFCKFIFNNILITISYI